MRPREEREYIRLAQRYELITFIYRCFRTVVPGKTFIDNWHLDAIAYHLEECAAGRIRRLIVTVPPRSGKSLCASVAFVARLLGLDPTQRIVCVSYSQDLTAKHARDCRRVVESDWYRDVFPNTRINPRKNTETEFETTAGGYRFGTSIGGTLTGRGGNVFIIDDPMMPGDAMSATQRKAVKEWYDSTLYSRLDSKRDAVIIIVMQRLHDDDLVAHVLEKEAWVHLNLPAIAEVDERIPIGRRLYRRRRPGGVLQPKREPLDVLDQIKATLGAAAFSAQYQQAPVPLGGALIQWAWFRRYNSRPCFKITDRVVQSWDTASKAGELNDYSVCTTWLIRDKRYYLVDVLRERLDYPHLRRRIIEHARQHQADTVLIEDAGSGSHLIQDLRHSGDLFPIDVRPEGDKVMRMSAHCATLEAGRVLIPEVAPWLGDFETEIKAFPGGRYDDQVDSLSQFLTWLRDRERRRGAQVPSEGWQLVG